MNISRRWLLAGSAVVGAGALVACSSDGEATTGSSTNEGGSGSGEPIVFQAGYENHPGEPVDEGMKKWAELLEEKSGGSMKMELFPSSQLGSKTDLIDQMHAGSPIITLADGAFYADQGVPDFGITFAPFLFDDWDQAWKLTESDWYAEQTQKLHDKGLVLLSSKWKYGDRHTLINKQIDGVEGLKGMKIRVPNNVIQIKGFEALGATPTPMALGDVYTSLQQGTIDGLENPIPVLANGKFHEVAKYLILDGHVRNFTTWLTGASTFDALTDEQKEILKSTGDEAGLFNNDLVDQATETDLQTMKDGGVTVLDLDPEEFKAKAQAFYEMPEIQGMWSDGLYDTVKEAMS